jgi:hypothetical protein
MSTNRELVIDWLFNTSVQIGLFAILAAALSPLIAKPKRNISIAFISRYSPSVLLRLSSIPSGNPVQVWPQRGLSSS